MVAIAGRHSRIVVNGLAQARAAGHDQLQAARLHHQIQLAVLLAADAHIIVMDTLQTVCPEGLEAMELLLR